MTSILIHLSDGTCYGYDCRRLQQVSLRWRQNNSIECSWCMCRYCPSEYESVKYRGKKNTIRWESRSACCAVAVNPTPMTTLQAQASSVHLICISFSIHHPSRMYNDNNDHYSVRLFFRDVDVLSLVLAMQSRHATMFVSLHSAQ